MARVFSQKHSSTSVGNGSIYSVGKDRVYQNWQFSKTECFVGISREGLTREALAKHSCLHLSWLFAFQSCAGHMHYFAGCLLASYPRKHFSLQCLESSHSPSLSHITLTNKSHMKYRVQKIEHNYNQIWHGIKANKTHSCKLQLYIKNKFSRKTQEHHTP